MDIEEYHRRIEQMHTVTGVPSYWEQLQAMTAERDRWREIASKLAFWGAFTGSGLAAFHEWQQADHEFLKAVRGE
jgi:hypothetical protein